MNVPYGQYEEVPAQMHTPEGDVGIFELAVGYMPVAQALAAQLQDKYKLMINAERKLNTAKAAGQSTAYIKQLEANYLAAKRNYEKQLEGEASTKTYRLLGQVGVVTAIGVGAAAIYYILTRAMR